MKSINEKNQLSFRGFGNERQCKATIHLRKLPIIALC